MIMIDVIIRNDDCNIITGNGKKAEYFRKSMEKETPS